MQLALFCVWLPWCGWSAFCYFLLCNPSLFHLSIPRSVWSRSTHTLKTTSSVASTSKTPRSESHSPIQSRFNSHVPIPPQTRESRTVTHFQYLTWTSLGAPPSATPLLEFRRKVNKAAGQPQTPLLVHCSGGVGRTGTYMLIDMALTRIQSGEWAGVAWCKWVEFHVLTPFSQVPRRLIWRHLWSTCEITGPTWSKQRYDKRELYFTSPLFFPLSLSLASV